ncbi:uncharacterized protein LOC143291437 isoform X1 [Babylonia areolata]|uniref:uncharacterized protein LOC143291437 isoform X1 n=1 Tax=Babylonia areolata TaxID=304850 RepID=UPI003FD0028E
MCFFSGLLFLWLLSTSRSCDCSNLTSVVARPILRSKAVGDSKASLTFAVDVNQTCHHHEQGKITVVDVIHPNKSLCRFLRKDGTCQPVYDASRENCCCHTENNTYTVRGSGRGWEIIVQCNGEKHPVLLREPQVTNLTISIQNKTATSSSLSLDNTTTAPPATLNSTPTRPASTLNNISTAPLATLNNTPTRPASTLNSTPTRPASTLNNTHTSLASTLTPTPSAAADVAAPATAADAASVAEVSINCSWEEGEPAESWGKAQLSKDGTVLPATETTTEASTSGPPRVRHLHYVIKHARCEDSGRVECRVPGTEVSLTRNLLVGCGPPFDGTEREPSTWTSSDVPETSTSTEMDQGGPPFDGTEREPSTWTSSDVPETSTSTEMDQATDEPPAQKSVGQLHLFVTAGVSTLCFVALFVVIALLCRLKSSLKGMKQRYVYIFRVVTLFIVCVQVCV